MQRWTLLIWTLLATAMGQTNGCRCDTMPYYLVCLDRYDIGCNLKNNAQEIDSLPIVSMASHHGRALFLVFKNNPFALDSSVRLHVYADKQKLYEGPYSRKIILQWDFSVYSAQQRYGRFTRVEMPWFVFEYQGKYYTRGYPESLWYRRGIRGFEVITLLGEGTYDYYTFIPIRKQQKLEPKANLFRRLRASIRSNKWRKDTLTAKDFSLLLFTDNCSLTTTLRGGALLPACAG